MLGLSNGRIGSVSGRYSRVWSGEGTKPPGPPSTDNLLRFVGYGFSRLRVGSGRFDGSRPSNPVIQNREGRRWTNKSRTENQHKSILLNKEKQHLQHTNLIFNKTTNKF